MNKKSYFVEDKTKELSLEERLRLKCEKAIGQNGKIRLLSNNSFEFTSGDIISFGHFNEAIGHK